jgi:phosphoglycolate phosphatase
MNTLPQKRAAVFLDFDGVMVDTFDLTYRIRTIIEPTMTREVFREHFKGNIYDAKPDRIPTQDDLGHMSLLYQNGLREKELVAGMKKVIQELKQLFILVIISSSPSSVIREYLRGQEIADHISFILGSDVHIKKEVKITNALKSLAIKRTDALLITDTLGDIMEARKAGVRSIGIDWGLPLT